MAKVGDLIEILFMQGEPEYTHRKGKIEYIDSIGQLHGTWGSLAVIPGEDTYRVIKEGEQVCLSG